MGPHKFTAVSDPLDLQQPARFSYFLLTGARSAASGNRWRYEPHAGYRPESAAGQTGANGGREWTCRGVYFPAQRLSQHLSAFAATRAC